MNDKKRTCIGFFILIFPITVYLGYCVSNLYNYTDVNLNNLIAILERSILHPSLSIYNDNTLACIFVAILIWMIAFLSAYTEASRNLMHGAEHGTAKWQSYKEFNKKYASENEKQNRILSQHIRMDYDTAKHLRNMNMFIFGGSGSGKTAFINSPNLLQMVGSNIYTDPKGGLLADYGNFLKDNGVKVQVINLCQMSESMRYNPFVFIRSEQDIIKLVTNLMDNTKTEGASTGDQFWEDSAKQFLMSLFNYIWRECPRTEFDKATKKEINLDMTFRTLLYLMREANIDDDGNPSLLELRMAELRRIKPDCKAVTCFFKAMSGAADTKRSVVATVNSRLALFENEELLRILDGNDIHIDEVGTGVNNDGKTKTALFMIIPDDDTSFNFIPGMLYTQLFQELYFQARFYPKQKLPLSVGFWFDEFANIKMPANFDKILATCRSRNIYCVPFLQSLAQIKKMFKEDAWEGIIGNCDTLIYLGGNEKGTYKYISELLGKWTIDKRTDGRTFGMSGNSSNNYDVLGRELMDENEVRLLKNDECIVFVRGEQPLKDKKWYPWSGENKKVDSGAKAHGEYIYHVKIEVDETTGRLTTVEDKKEIEKKDEVVLLDDARLNYFKRRQRTDRSIQIYEVTMSSFLNFDFDAAEKENKELSVEELADLLKDEEVSNKIKNGNREDADEDAQERYERFVDEYESRQFDAYDLYISDNTPDEIKMVILDCLKKQLPSEIVYKIINPNITREQREKLKEAALLVQREKKMDMNMGNN